MLTLRIMHTVLVTFLPDEKSGDVPYMDAHKFAVPPARGDFIALSKTRAFEVVQVVHYAAQHEDNYCVAVTPRELPHVTFLKSEESRDNQADD